MRKYELEVTVDVAGKSEMISSVNKIIEELIQSMRQDLLINYLNNCQNACLAINIKNVQALEQIEQIKKELKELVENFYLEQSFPTEADLKPYAIRLYRIFSEAKLNR